MTAWMKQWLLGVVAAALAASLADCLVVQPPLKRLAKLAGGILLALALLRPLTALPPVAASLEDYRRQAEETVQASQREQHSTLSAIIEEELAAYIVDKAAGMGLETAVRVAVAPDGEGTPLPQAVYLTIPPDSALSAWLEEALGLPPEAQFWQTP